MHLKNILSVLSCLFCATCFSQSIDGYWEGRIAIPGQDSLRIGFMIHQGDSLTIELDSPDQYVLGIKTQKVQFKDSTLTLEVPSIGASFKGKYTSNKQLTGTFKQGIKFPLTLSQNHPRSTFERPQTPSAPFPYHTEELHFRNRDGQVKLINGTLSYPNEGNPKMLYILISGSGWQDRDETIFGHKPFAIIADYLTKHNQAAVFRYDDFPPSIFSKSTTFNFADGVALIIDSLQQNPLLKDIPITLIGHSEGSLVAYIVASRDTRVDKIITLGGVAQPIKDILLYQIQAIAQANHQLSPEEIQYTVNVSEKLYNLIIRSKTSKEAAQKIGRFYDKEIQQLTKEQQQRYNFSNSGKLSAIQQLCSPWFFTLFHINPKTYLKKISCQTLAINGERDLQVGAASNQAIMQRYLPKNQRHEYWIVPNANHLLQPCETGSPNEYGSIETTIMEEVLEKIASF